MAVTRAKSKQTKINKKSKKKIVNNIKVRDIVIKLERLTQQQIKEMTEPKKRTIEQQNGKYELRKRTEKKTEQKVNKKATKTTAITKSSTQSVAVLWAAAKKEQKQQQPLAVKTIILAKMRSYSPWPAKLVSIEKKRAQVYFFGTDNHGSVDKDDIVTFKRVPILIKKLLTMKIKHFEKAVREAEIYNGVPYHLSLIN